MQCLFWYILLKKKTILASLFSKDQNEKVAKLLSNDFTIPRWKTASVNNAYSLIQKKKFMEAAAFFLLGGYIDDTIKIVINSL